MPQDLTRSPRTLAETPEGSAVPYHAPVLRRFGAALIDLGWTFAPLGAILIFVAVTRTTFYVLSGASLLLYVTYSAVMEGRGGATLGKQVWGLRVVDAGERPIGYRRALVRALGKLVTLFTLGLGLVAAWFSEEGRALHDYPAGTRVLTHDLRHRWARLASAAALVFVPLWASAVVPPTVSAIRSVPELPWIGACLADPADAGDAAISGIPLPEPFAIASYEPRVGGTAELSGSTPLGERDAKRQIQRASRDHPELRGVSVVTDSDERGRSRMIFEGRWVVTYIFEPCDEGTNITASRV